LQDLVHVSASSRDDARHSCWALVKRKTSSS
jgi:hypothetical protein